MSDEALEIIDPVVADEHQLRRALGRFDLTLIGIGSVIGAGIFVVAGTAAAEHAGPAVMLSFIIASAGCFFAGLCYAEFAGMIPHAGSSYTYTYATMGRFMAWFVGWNMVLEYGVAGSGVAVGWSAYFLNLLSSFGITFPAAFANAPLAGADLGSMHFTGAIINLPALILVLALTTLLVVGVRETARFNGAMVLIKVSIVLLVILFGLPYVTAGHLTPFIPPNEGVWGKYGVSGILAASGIVFFAYVGFETVSVAAQESRDPQRDIPSAILITLVVCTTLYVLMGLVLTGITNWRDLDVGNPVSFAIGKIPALGWLTLPVNIGALGRARLRHLRHHVWPVPRLLWHGAGRFPAAGLCRRASQIPDPLALHHRHRRGGGISGGPVPARHIGRPGLHRHPGGVHFRLRLRADRAPQGAARPPAFPHPHDLADRPGGDPCLRADDPQPVQRHLDQAGGVDRDWDGDLLRLQYPPCPSVQMDRKKPGLT